MSKGRHGAVTLGGNPLTALGDTVEVGAKAPDFTLHANDFSKVTLADSAGKIRLISVVPSLNTSVCDAQTRRFNEEAASLSDNVVVLTVSADLPYAQRAWCGAAGVERVQTLSDHMDMNFGQAYGTHIEELRLDQRSVFVVDADDTVRYVEYVQEFGHQPDYEAVITAVRELTA
jgi:thiol peroxidase